jgi:uncharacterized membrane protein
MFTKLFMATIAAATLMSTLLLAAGSPANASTTPGGIIKFYSDQSNDTNGGATGPVVITGAIGDYGTATSINQNGTVNVKGNYVKVALKKGTFEINSVAFNKAANNAQPTFNSSNCSQFVSASGSVTVFDGTGAYAGIKGTLSVVATFAGVSSKLTSGKCNESQSAQPVAEYGTITGSGSVTF